MFQPMDPNKARALIEGHEDVITREVEEEKVIFENLKCPICYQGGCEKRLDPPKIVIGPRGEPVVAASPFVSGKALPQGFAHCIHCSTDFDPRSGIIRRTEASQIMPVSTDPASTIVSPPPGPRRG